MCVCVCVYIGLYASFVLCTYLFMFYNTQTHTHARTHEHIHAQTHTFAYWVETSRIPTFKKIFCNIIFSSTFYLFHLHLYMIRTEIDSSFPKKKKKMFYSDTDECKTKKTHVFTSHRIFFVFIPTNPQLFLYHKNACSFAYILATVSTLYCKSFQR